MQSLWREGPDDIPSTPWPEDDQFDEIVVGAGLTGMTTALLLARAGHRVGVLEARSVGSGTTGGTTGKLSLLQGDKLTRMLRFTSKSVVRGYLDGNREGQQWLLAFCARHGLAVQRRPAVTYAANDAQVPAVREEYAAARDLGLPAEWLDSLDMPFPVHGAVLLPDQAQFNPMDVLRALAVDLADHGGVIQQNCRVVGVSWRGRPRVTTAEGRTLSADHVVLATGVPMLDRGLYFAKVDARRSYLLALATPSPPEAMMISVDSSVRSLRDAPGGLMLVGGEGHGVGRTSSEQKHLDELRAWAATYFPEATETHAWSAQDYRSHDSVPIVGRLPRGFGRIFLATGYDKWGLAEAVAAARTISGQILGSRPSWAQPLARRVSGPRAAARLASMNAEVGVAATESLWGAARSHDVPPRCTHLGGLLHWNDAECTWDCPLHGSRFASDGSVLEGPATQPLKDTEDR